LDLVVTISGLHGTGKSTYSKWMAQEFGLRHVSAGDLFRQIASERGMALEELSVVAQQDDSIDHLVDDRTKQEAAKGDVVIDGQLAGWMAADRADLKIYLTAPTKVRIERMAKRDGVAYGLKEKETAMRERIQHQRYLDAYGIDVDNLSVYDLVIDTSLLPLEENINILKRIVSDYLAEHCTR
jgi:cytidylate kinase